MALRRGLGLVLWLVLLVGTLACLPLRCTSDLPEVKEASPISPEQANAVGERLGQALEGGQEVIRLSFAQEELNSLLGGMLPQEKGQDQGLPLSSAEIRLHQGEVELLAGLRKPVPLPARLSLALRLEGGKPHLELRRVQFGFVELPWYVLELVSRGTNYWLQEQALPLQIQELEIEEGTLRLSVRKPDSSAIEAIMKRAEGTQAQPGGR